MMLKIEVPEDFNFEQCLRFLNRNALESTHHVLTDGVLKLQPTSKGPMLLSIKRNSKDLEIAILNGEPDVAVQEEIEVFAKDWFDLQTELTDFYSRTKDDPVLGGLVKKYGGLRLIGIPDLFEALGWAIIGQQINLTFAYQLKKRMVETFGEKFTYNNQDHYSFPDPKLIAPLQPEDLRGMQFSNSKARYLINLAQSAVEGKLNKQELQSMSISEASDHLCQFKGIGPWSAHYAIMKCLRFPSAFPIADVGLHHAIKNQLKLAEKPSIEQIKELAANWKGWEAYATFYLWHSLIID
ncbi:MAG: DNA-3-methyladenine glycosylase family protein [Cyclobacteriaceae bacterium]